MTDTKQTEAEEIRKQRTEYLRSLPQFRLLDRVEIKEWFYKGYKWQVFNEWEANPLWLTDFDVYQDLVIISYKVLIYDTDDKLIDTRIVETKYMEAIEYTKKETEETE